MELDLLTIERIERYIVFESQVWLNGWIDTSGHGFKITLGLPSRAELDAFDGTMKRRKRKGGQRYHMILTPLTGNIEEVPQHEVQFCGRGWNETKGAHIALHVPDLTDQHWWRIRKAGDQEGECFTGNIILMEIGDDEVIIDQTMRDRAERAELKGGPRSKHVARMLQDLEFQQWLDKVSIYQNLESPFDFSNFEECDALMKDVCGIKSKIEFDNNGDAAWQIWENQFQRPFIQHMQRNDQGHTSRQRTR